MRIGKISLNVEFLVDLDNVEMVDIAKRLIVEDLNYIVKHETYFNHIKCEEINEWIPEEVINVMEKNYECYREHEVLEKDE